MPNGSKTFKDWKKGGHGEVDLSKAITVSCDTFFYGLGLELGVNRMNKTLSKYYFGKKTGVDMLNEKIGLLADEEWKKNKFNKPWYGGETAITAIGQGFTQVTPIQLAYATALIANPELNNAHSAAEHHVFDDNTLIQEHTQTLIGILWKPRYLLECMRP